MLTSLGFLALVEVCRKLDGANAPLFPLMRPGPRGGYAEGWSKWFGRYLRSIGIGDTNRVFHSFRHSFKDAARAAGVREDINDALTGHSGGGVGRQYGSKSMVRRFGLPQLYQAVARVEYPGLDLTHLLSS
jgi:integrase